MTLTICSELTIFAFFSWLHVVFLAQWFVNFFLTFFKASTSYGYFHYVSYCVFAHWFSLNQMFKFSVSFATEVEKKTRPLHGQCLDRSLRSTKYLKEGIWTPFSSNKWRTCLEIPVVIMENFYPCSFKCLKSVAVMACMWLPPFLFFTF